ncbi:MAG: type transporter [Thermomicrobiales bacterium]|jgi:ABC-2 type transport system permease protein|nr:type transporter [Thermomicrobiales bacterium]
MNRSLRPLANPLPGAGLWWETRASLAFVERNLYLVRRYWHLELAFLVFNVASAMSVLYIGEAQMQSSGGDSREGQLDLVLYLGIGTVVWAYLRAVFANVGEMVAWERWEGTIEYTMMAPISRLAHMLGVSLFSIIYGLARSALLLGVLALFFSVDLSNANLGGAALILLVGSVSFLGFGIMAAVLPLLFPERGEEMTFVISSILLLVSGVYYPISVLPDWMEPLATVSPATYVLEGMRAALLEGTPTLALGPSILPILILGALTLPIGIAIFSWGERYAKRTGRLKRSG